MFPATSKFLVIDDSSTMRFIVKNMLITLGYSNMEEAEDGVTGFAAMENALKNGAAFDCIISDWNMPNMTGIELLRKVRTTPVFKSVPFVLVTAENESKQVVEAAVSGVSNYIVKPFSEEDFRSKLLATYNRHFVKKAA